MRWVSRLRTIVVVLGWLAGVVGVAFAVNAMTQAPAYVKVPVTLATGELGGGPTNVRVELPGVQVPDGWFAGAMPAGSRVSGSGQGGGPDSQLTLVAWGSTRVEQLLSRGDWLVGGLGTLVGALALAPVLGSIAEGRPFAPGNARRLAVIAALVAVTGVLAPLLPQVAGLLVLERTGLAGPRFLSAPSFAVGPVLAGLVVLAVAGAFRAGERMADDLRGLV